MHKPSGRRLRWLLLLGASLMLHLLLLAAAGGGLHVPRPARPAQVMSVALQAAPAQAAAMTAPAVQAAAPVDASAPRPVKPRRRARPKPAAVSAPVAATVPAAESEIPVAQPVAAADAPASDAPASDNATPDTVAGDAATPGNPASAATGVPAAADRASPDATTAATAAAPANAPAVPAKHYRSDPPPSATLDYEVRYVTRGNTTRGSSVIAWRNEGGSYAIQGQVTKFGFMLSSFRSEGAFDANGIAPILYAEKNARRTETNTHFSRDQRQAISFSATTEHFPLADGAQDRGSILWQLAGIARADPAQLAPGAVLDIFVAGVRDAEHWLIEVLGEESVTLEHGDMRAWHLVRAPRAGTYDKRIDIWLAPAQQWYPVKLRYTEVSGDTLDLSLDAIH